MSIALEIRGLCKRYVAGVHGCLAAANVLRGIDIVLREGDVHVIVGPAGSGKSTLMLCAAGLLTSDGGEVRWFGDVSRASGARRALYHHAGVDLLRTGAIHESHVHLLDVESAGVATDVIDAWIAERQDCGDAVLIASRDDAIATRIGARISTLRGGRLQSVVTAPLTARVAEAALG
ncbi:MAG TPA: ATP-binding cassette domain-containing protein [Gemmatimonadaceae bacterium]|jgi:ABC-type uncharacterized transport system ATPase subunit